MLGQYGGRDAALRAAALGGIGGLVGPKGMDIFEKGGLFSGGSKFGKGASGFGNFFLGKAVGDKVAIDGLIGSGDPFIPTKWLTEKKK